MSKLLEALKKVLPEEAANELVPAVEAMVAEAKTELETEYNTNLEEAYAKMAEELKGSEEVAETGYQEAYSIITDLRNRLETQKVEFEKTLEEGYEEAYQMLVEERSKNEKLEVSIYEEYDKKLAEMREYFVDKIDEFLKVKGEEYYEQACKAAANDPQLAEQKVVVEKIASLLADYSGDDYSKASSEKLEDALRQLDDLRSKQRIMESRNIRLNTENKKLNESVRTLNEQVQTSSEQLIKEERIERAESAKKATGKGEKVTDRIVAEAKDEPVTADEPKSVLNETMDVETLRVLSGIKKNS